MLAEDVGSVGFDDDPRLEVTTGIIAEVLVGSASEAVDAGVLAAAVGIDTPAEAKPRRVCAIDDGLALDLFEDDA